MGTCKVCHPQHDFNLAQRMQIQCTYILDIIKPFQSDSAESLNLEQANSSTTLNTEVKPALLLLSLRLQTDFSPCSMAKQTRVIAYLFLSIQKDTNWSKIFTQAKRYLSKIGKQGAPFNSYSSFSSYTYMLFLSPVACWCRLWHRNWK